MISIIVPVYNTEKYLERCIHSILKQTYLEYEIILVDDGSTDKSGSICDSLAKQYSSIKVIHTQNDGPAAAREQGIAVAQGEFIMFVDSDDWIHQDILKILLEEQQRSDANIVCCIFVDVDEKGNMHHLSSCRETIIDCYSAEDCIMHMHKTRYLTGSPCTKLYRTSLFDNIDYHKDVMIGEDYAMIVQLVQKACRVRILNKELYYRFVRKGSISHGGFTERHKKAFDNYMTVRLNLIRKYPRLQGDIIAFHTEFEMAVITAMCRNKAYDNEVIEKLKKDLRANMRNTLQSRKIPFYMKICAVMIGYVHPLFILLFRLLYLVTGR